jgi:hypothetical protein
MTRRAKCINIILKLNFKANKALVTSYHISYSLVIYVMTSSKITKNTSIQSDPNYHLCITTLF